MEDKTVTMDLVTNEKPREYLFDNIRAILIILVVWGHILSSMKEESNIIKSIYYFMYFFHMPAMVFVSGYFSKNLDKIRSKAVETIFFPYLYLNIIQYVILMFVVRDPFTVYRFFDPYWGLWYMLALFVWKFFLKDLVKIRYILPLSIIVAIVSGYSEEFSEYMAMGRIFCLFPFFLLGYYCKKDHVDKIRSIPRIISWIIVSAIVVLSAFIASYDIIDKEYLYLRGPYPVGTELSSMVYRIIIYLIASVMIVSIINLTTAKRTFLDNIGTSTITVYVLHLFTIPILETYEILKDMPNLYLLYSIIVTAIIVFLYSRSFVKHAYDKIMDGLTRIIIKTMKK